MLANLIELIDKMSQNSEFKDGWKELEPTVGINHIVTLNWPKFRLKLVSFKMPHNWDGSLEKAENIVPLDALYLDKDDVIIWRTQKNTNDKNWDDLERALVVDVVDRFLAGEWTPPWKCGFCASRHNGSMKPRW
ncbi:hypothetical protein UFOVP657_30 [uncultured Caudovirales phage]|uniref:Uncharacterized protein n=1 Tax=uncultured Caudovirales phage TaxID=2100421 RepID=A0A6J5NGF3_9CAUD|nr:hypothetical protein UFOVP467_4 [uncultured Caudovirales phage]CAB4155988.1 hypothetical protein UFOVP657_30 [uncultured Caudovirales phage]